MNEIELQQLLDIAWRRPLTPDEEASLRAWCQAHPAAAPAIESEVEVARAMHRLPAVEVPSNFVSRVWQGVEREESKAARAAGSGVRLRLPRLLRAWMPRLAVAGVVGLLGTAAWLRHESLLRTEIAHDLAALSAAADLPDPGMLEEFDAVRIMAESSPQVDLELLAALQ